MIFSDKTSNFFISQNDSIHIPLRPDFQSFVNIQGQIKNPGEYPYNEKMKLKDLLDATMSLDDNNFFQTMDLSKIKCFSIGNALHENPMYIPNINYEEKDKDLKINQKEVALKLFKIRNQNLALDKDTNDVYDYDAYKKGELLFLGKFIQNKDGKYELVQN